MCEPSAQAFRARWLLPVTRPPIRDGLLTVRGERILAVGENSSGRPAVDLGDVALLPCFINPHTHLEFSDQEEPLGEPRAAFVEWIRMVIAERTRKRRDPIGAIQRGLAESRRAGVVAIGETATLPPDDYSASDPLPTPVLFHEVIGFSSARIKSSQRALEDRLASGGQVGRQQGISPHAPYTVHPDLLARLAALAAQQNLPLSMHIAESREELALLAHGTGPLRDLLEERSMWDAESIPRGSRPLAYLQQLAKAPRAIVVHGNYLEDEELAFLSQQAGRMTLVYCPRTHAYFGHAPYPLERALDLGVEVAVGTDSRASNPDLDMLRELQQVLRRHPHVDPAQILRLGTWNAARALAVDRDWGSLEPGKRADFVTVALDDRNAAAVAQILTAHRSACRNWIAGQLSSEEGMG